MKVPERNRAIKKLLETTYGKGVARVCAGKGTAYHWVEITFSSVPDALRKQPYGGVLNTLEALIRGAGIQLSTYSDDMGGRDHVCISVTGVR